MDCGGVLRVLMEKKLIRVLGRKEIPGRPLIYATTKHFLEVFELKNLKDLPSLKEIEKHTDLPQEKLAVAALLDSDTPLEKETAASKEMDAPPVSDDASKDGHPPPSPDTAPEEEKTLDLEDQSQI